MTIEVGATPNETAPDPKASQDLGHLAVVTKHVADEPRRQRLGSERAGNLPAQPQIAYQRLPRYSELVWQYVPWTDDELSQLDQVLNQLAALRSNFQIILQDDGLAIRLEGTLQTVLFPARYNTVQETHQAETEVLEGLVPLAVPMGAEDIMYAAFHDHTSSIQITCRPKD